MDLQIIKIEEKITLRYPLFFFDKLYLFWYNKENKEESEKPYETLFLCKYI